MNHEQHVGSVAGMANGLFPSIKVSEIKFAAPPGYRSLNPSIIRGPSGLHVVQRTVGYGDGWVSTRNFWADLTPEFKLENIKEILPSRNYPPIVRKDCIGLIDMRPFIWKNEIWNTASTHELNPKGYWAEIGLSRLDFSAEDHVEFTDFSIIAVEGNPGLHEKNWMVLVESEEPLFVYSIAPFSILDQFGRIVFTKEVPMRRNVSRGGTQMLPFRGGRLSFIHEVFWVSGKRYYAHRAFFVSSDYSQLKFTKRFFFTGQGTEFAAGIAWGEEPSKILVSFGVEDRESWIATIESDEIENALLTPNEVDSPLATTRLSPSLGGAFWNADPSARRFSEVHTCSVIDGLHLAEDAKRFIANEGLKNPSDMSTSCAQFLAMYHAAAYCDQNSAVMEVKSSRNSPFLQSIVALGFCNVVGIDTSLTRNERHKGVEWFRSVNDATDFKAKIQFLYDSESLDDDTEFETFLNSISMMLADAGLAFIRFPLQQKNATAMPGASETGAIEAIRTDRLALFPELAKKHNFVPSRQIDSIGDLPSQSNGGDFSSYCNLLLKRLL